MSEQYSSIDIKGYFEISVFKITRVNLFQFSKYFMRMVVCKITEKKVPCLTLRSQFLKYGN